MAWNDTLGFWAVSRMAEVMAVSTDNATFCSSQGILTMEIGTTYDSPPTMMHTDPPDHTVYRKLVQPPFGRRLVGGMDDSIRSRATRLLGALPLGEAGRHRRALLGAAPRRGDRRPAGDARHRRPQDRGVVRGGDPGQLDHRPRRGDGADG